MNDLYLIMALAWRSSRLRFALPQNASVGLFRMKILLFSPTKGDAKRMAIRKVICSVAVAAALSACASRTLTRDEVKVDLVKVVKSERRLYLMSDESVLRQFRISLGAAPTGHKEQEGDERTPEGPYMLDYKKTDSNFYKAIHVSYPNKKDVENAKRKGVSPGGDIMVHGQKNGLGWLSFLSQRIDWTNGCIGLSNKDMDEVWRLVNSGTPIEIVP
jgi:murein L,D-transpeptidase YafK